VLLAAKAETTTRPSSTAASWSGCRWLRSRSPRSSSTSPRSGRSSERARLFTSTEVDLQASGTLDGCGLSYPYTLHFVGTKTGALTAVYNQALKQLPPGAFGQQ
jgi:hypothetical protein